MANVGRQFVPEQAGTIKLCGRTNGFLRCKLLGTTPAGKYWGLIAGVDGVNYPTHELQYINGSLVADDNGGPYLFDQGEGGYFEFTQYPSTIGDDPHDCLNGQCVAAVANNTPGYYPNLAACQAACGGGTPCDGECVSAAKLAALQQAANTLQSRMACR